VADTLITNEPAEARAFCADHHEVVYKALRGGPLTEAGVPVALYTGPVDADEITDQVAHTAHLFQVAVPKAYEVRLTIVGARQFGLRIDATNPAGRLDWRAGHDQLRYSVVEIPARVSKGVSEMMRHFELTYAAADFIVTPAGE